MCYRFRIISEIKSNDEFSSRETKTPVIRMNTKMLNAFLLFSHKRNNKMSWNFHRLVLLHISCIEAFKDTLPIVCNGFKTLTSSINHLMQCNSSSKYLWYRQHGINGRGRSHMNSELWNYCSHKWKTSIKCVRVATYSIWRGIVKWYEATFVPCIHISSMF